MAVINAEEPSKLGEGGELVESDETATAQRKYQRGKPQRQGEVVWWSTAVQTKEVETPTGTKQKSREGYGSHCPRPNERNP